MAPKSPAKNKASPINQQKSPKKPKTSGEEVAEEVPAVGAEEEPEADEAELDKVAAEAGDVYASETPAAHTRAHDEGGAGAMAAKQTAAKAAANALPQPTIVDILLGDHRDTVALLKHFEVSGDKLMLEKLTDAIAITIRLHSQAEFEVLYPMMERRLGDSCKEARQHSMEEHSKIEEDLIKALEMRKEGGKELAGTMKEVMDLFIKHLGEEENELVPKMLAQMSEEEQVELAASFLAAKAKAPLTPQPIAT